MLTKRKRRFSFNIVMNELKAARTRLGWRPEVVAGRADISLVYYRRLEAGLSQPTLPIARRVAEALGSTVDALWPPAAGAVVAPESVA